jgi:ubiquinone/menaquinone biosynthesis C-methylase UbiE
MKQSPQSDHQHRNKPLPTVVLDFGCGSGNVTVAFMKVFPKTNQLIAFDMSQKMIDYAQANYASEHEAAS